MIHLIRLAITALRAKPVQKKLCHSLGGAVFFLFSTFKISCLGFNALFALLTKEGGNKGIKVKLGFICGEKHSKKLWHSMDKRA